MVTHRLYPQNERRTGGGGRGVNSDTLDTKSEKAQPPHPSSSQVLESEPTTGPSGRPPCPLFLLDHTCIATQPGTFTRTNAQLQVNNTCTHIHPCTLTPRHMHGHQAHRGTHTALPPCRGSQQLLSHPESCALTSRTSMASGSSENLGVPRTGSRPAMAPAAPQHISSLACVAPGSGASTQCSGQTESAPPSPRGAPTHTVPTGTMLLLSWQNLVHAILQVSA